MDAKFIATFRRDLLDRNCDGTLRVEMKEGDYRWSQQFVYKMYNLGSLLVADIKYNEIKLWHGLTLVRKISLALPMNECDRMLMNFIGMVIEKVYKEWKSGYYDKVSTIDSMSFDTDPLLSVAQDMYQTPPIFNDAAFGEGPVT